MSTTKKPAPKAKSEATPAVVDAAKSDLTERELKVLKALKAAGKKALTRAELSTATGIPRGWSKLLGAATKQGLGKRGKASLEGRGLIASSRAEGELTLSYTLTAAGTKALAAAQP
jgi:hypothetical protein